MANQEHRVQLGDDLIRIALQRGFRTLRPLRDAPDNKPLLARRANPFTLAVGDVVAVPEFERQDKSAVTNRFHRFTVADSGVLLNLVLQDTERRPLANRAYRLVVAEHDPRSGLPAPFPPIDDVTTAKGEVSQEIPPFAFEGELVVRATDQPESPVAGKIKLLIGVLEAANTIRGQQVRLNNMGYFAGFSEQHLEQLRWAIEEFQADHKLPVTGRFDDPKTFNRIAREHGDLLEGEQVP